MLRAVCCSQQSVPGKKMRDSRVRVIWRILTLCFGMLLLVKAQQTTKSTAAVAELHRVQEFCYHLNYGRINTTDVPFDVKSEAANYSRALAAQTVMQRCVSLHYPLSNDDLPEAGVEKPCSNREPHGYNYYDNMAKATNNTPVAAEIGAIAWIKKYLVEGTVIHNTPPFLLDNGFSAYRSVKLGNSVVHGITAFELLVSQNKGYDKRIRCYPWTSGKQNCSMFGQVGVFIDTSYRKNNSDNVCWDDFTTNPAKYPTATDHVVLDTYPGYTYVSTLDIGTASDTIMVAGSAKVEITKIVQLGWQALENYYTLNVNSSYRRLELGAETSMQSTINTYFVAYENGMCIFTVDEILAYSSASEYDGECDEEANNRWLLGTTSKSSNIMLAMLLERNSCQNSELPIVQITVPTIDTQYSSLDNSNLTGFFIDCLKEYHNTMRGCGAYQCRINYSSSLFKPGSVVLSRNSSLSKLYDATKIYSNSRLFRELIPMDIAAGLGTASPPIYLQDGSTLASRASLYSDYGYVSTNKLLGYGLSLPQLNGSVDAPPPNGTWGDKIWSITNETIAITGLLNMETSARGMYAQAGLEYRGASVTECALAISTVLTTIVAYQYLSINRNVRRLTIYCGGRWLWINKRVMYYSLANLVHCIAMCTSAAPAVVLLINTTVNIPEGKYAQTLSYTSDNAYIDGQYEINVIGVTVMQLDYVPANHRTAIIAGVIAICVAAFWFCGLTVQLYTASRWTSGSHNNYEFMSGQVDGLQNKNLEHLQLAYNMSKGSKDGGVLVEPSSS